MNKHAIAIVILHASLAAAERPTPQLNRAAEDWSVLADPALRTEPLDELKYLRLGGDDPATYLSLGLTLRDRFEWMDAPLFGVKGRAHDAYDLQRLQVHGDLHLDAHWNVFVQLEDVRAFDKGKIGPADENPVDLRQAFVMFQHALGPGTLRLRFGRQEITFDLQRFISLRDGPNVQQGFDGLWAAYALGAWELRGFASLPVEYEREAWFDDGQSFDDYFALARLERVMAPGLRASLYYAVYGRPDVTYVDASGRERRHLVDARFVGARARWDWDVEAMGQFGHVGGDHIRAWATGARAGYTLGATRFGVQADTASGDEHAGDDKIETFIPLFPNGYYFTQASVTGYANLVHVKPSVTLKVTPAVLALVACGAQWRASTADAIYLHPLVPLPSSAGVPGAWTGGYVQLRTEVKVGRVLVLSGEYVHFEAGHAIRSLGGGNSDYVAFESKLSW